MSKLLPIFDYDDTLVGTNTNAQIKRLLIDLAKTVKKKLKVPLIIFTAGSACGRGRPYDMLKSLNPTLGKYESRASVVIIGREYDSNNIKINGSTLMTNGVKYLKNFYDELLSPKLRENVTMVFFDDMTYHRIGVGIGKGARGITDFHSNSIAYFKVSADIDYLNDGNMIRDFIEAVRNDKILWMDNNFIAIHKQRMLQCSPYQI